MLIALARQGGSYAGSRAAEILAKSLPETHRVILIERQSSFRHLYLFPRYLPLCSTRPS